MSIGSSGNVTYVQAIIMDVDGVLTDGSIIMGNGDQEFKSFHVRDGMAITVARKCGIKTGFITSRKSEIVRRRAEELNIDYLFQGVRDKMSKLKEISTREGIPLENVCYIGDDFLDIPILRQVGFAATVQDAPDEVKACVSYVSPNCGGREAVRDIIRHVLISQGKWETTVVAMISDWEKGVVD